MRDPPTPWSSPSFVAAASAKETVPGRKCRCAKDRDARSSLLLGNRGACTCPIRALPALPASTYCPGLTRWNTVPAYPLPTGAVTNPRKFSTTFGTSSPYNPISMRPTTSGSEHKPPAPPNARSARTMEGQFPISRNTRCVIRGRSATSKALTEDDVDATSAAPTREARRVKTCEASSSL